jgi:phosphoglucosamine mutase
MSRRYFGTDGIRGAVGSATINPSFFLKLGSALGKVISSHKNASVVIGCDTRESCESLQQALSRGLLISGAQVHLAGVIPTPAVAYLTRASGMAAGIVISASHNHYQDNGVKFFDSRGMKFDDATEIAIESSIDQVQSVALNEDQNKVATLSDASDRYMEFCRSTVAATTTFNHLKIVVDCANGATYRVAPATFLSLGAEVITLGCEPDGTNINVGCGATDVSALQQAVLQHQADLGIAFDGDGDRVMMVDHTGALIDGDVLLCILALAGLDKHQGVVGTLMSNLGLEQAITQAGLGFERTNVGDRFVLERLLEKGWSLGGESSGHIVNLNYTTTGDGIVSALQVLAVMYREKKSLYQLKQAMVKQPQVLINVATSKKLDLAAHPDLMRIANEAEQSMQGQGRVLLRASGTECCVRVMVEGEDRMCVQQCAESLARLVKNYLGKVNE